jgi:hypothetical protein
MNNAARINIALDQLEKEIELEVIQIKTAIVHTILNALETYSPNPLSSTYSIGNFAVNTFIDIGNKNLQINNSIYTNLDSDFIKNISGHYTMLQASTNQEIIKKPFETIYIHNAIAYNILVEYLGWNASPAAIEPDIIDYSSSVGQGFDSDVWSKANHAAYKPFTIAFRIAKAELPSIVKRYNRTTR